MMLHSEAVTEWLKELVGDVYNDRVEQLVTLYCKCINLSVDSVGK